LKKWFLLIDNKVNMRSGPKGRVKEQRTRQKNKGKKGKIKNWEKI
jgi:hypothetical protein